MLSSTSSSPFGSSIFSSNWNASRDRASTHAGNQSADPTSPTASGFQKDFSDTDVKTLDYLGLVDRPQQNQTSEMDAYLASAQASTGINPLIANLSDLNKINRFRSFSVNAKEQKAAEEYGAADQAYYSGAMTPQAEAIAAAIAQTQHEINQHNMNVQAFVNSASSNRPRARTAGAAETPASRMYRNQGQPFLGNDAGLGSVPGPDYSTLTDAIQAMNLQQGMKSSGMLGDFDADTVAECTRALWLGGIPSSTTPSSLKVIFEAYGKIESARVLTHKSCGFVNFESIESAVSAKAQLNGKEIFPGSGPIRIGYAKAPSTTGTPGPNSMFQSPSPDPTTQNQNRSRKDSGSFAGTTAGQREYGDGGASIQVPDLRDIRLDILQMVKELGASDEDQANISRLLDEAIINDSHEPEIPAVPEASHNRMFDAPKLRDIRKKIDNNTYSLMEVEDIAMSMLPEIAELSSDYLGNTVVQKLFEHCNEHIKEAMLREIAPRLAEIGVHKNGTWAAQKIIDVARTPNQMNMIVDNLRQYAMSLFLDQYGNYVIQCCLRFQSPFNQFIFETMLSRLWSVAQGRFGARAMRACLESHFSTKDQQRMLAAAVALHSVHLATNANGALLLTWFLDTCNFPHRRKVLAPRLVPHLVHLCTHKVAYLTVLKIINQRNEPEARDTMLQALFFTPDDQVLEEILQDQACGAMLIFKVLTTPFFDEEMRSKIVENVRQVLLKIKAQPSQGYKRLMDEVGLSVRGSVSAGRDSIASGRDGSEPLMTPATPGGQGPGSLFNGQMQAPFNQNLSLQTQRSSSVDSNMSYDQFSPMTRVPQQMFSPNTGMSPSAMSQLQYQQALLPNGRSMGQYNMNAAPVNNFANPALSGTPRGSIGSQQSYPMGGAAMMQQPGFNGQSGFSPVNPMNNGNMRMWHQQHQHQQHQQQQYPGNYMMAQQQHMQGQAMMGAGGSRGRVSVDCYPR